jgi:TolB-like protein/Tfp pilus assembly protein PilF
VQRKPAIAALIASLIALSATVGWNVWRGDFVRRPTANGIAVLPFENLSNDREDASFADGVQDDLLTKLANIADLKVISRASVMQYRPPKAVRAGRNTREIGNALRVSHVLEGSVRKTGAWLHMNAQLIDTRTDSHVWAKQYDGDLKDLFTIQSEIAETVAEQLHAKVSPAEKLAIERPPTVDLTAFDLYNRAKTLLLGASFSSKSRENLLQATDLLNQAVAHDPTFFQAYCQLALTHDLLYFLGDDHTPARLALAEAAVQAAFRLRTDAGEAHVARAGNLYMGCLDYDGALTELDTAHKTLPNDPEVFELRGYIERRQGKQEEALRSLELAVELDPRNVLTLQQLALSYEWLRRYAEAESVWNRVLLIKPNDLETELERARVELNWKADTRPLHQMVDSIRATNHAAIPSIADYWVLCALAEHDAAAAPNALMALGDTPFRDGTLQFSRPFVEGIIARMAKDEDEARAAFTTARAEQEKIVRTQPDYGPPLCVLGLIDAALGRKEDALQEGRHAVELLPVNKDALNGRRIVAYFAMIAAWVGDKNLACEQLEIAIQHSNSPSYGELKLLPFWDPLRGDPRFEKIVAFLAPKGT